MAESRWRKALVNPLYKIKIILYDLNMSGPGSLKRTPVYDQHLALNAKMVPFGGWEMPLQYEGIINEYNETRKRVTIFDTSHMGEFLVKGDAKSSGLDRLVTQRLDDLSVKSCRYGAMLNDRGNVMDDLIVYRISEKCWMVVVNGATMEKDAGQFQKVIEDKSDFENISSQTGKLDVQGPGSRDLLSRFISGIGNLNYYTFDEFECMGEKVVISRTGYTGELGFEIYYPWAKTEDLWKVIIGKGAKPAGLGVRDMLRIEMGYSLYGHELSEDINPLDAGLGRFVDWEKDFIGKAALSKKNENGTKQKVICLASKTRRSPRARHKIYSLNNEEIGHITSGTFSPSLERGIGLGFIKKDSGSIGDKILFGDDENKWEAEVSARPIYKNGSLKN